MTDRMEHGMSQPGYAAGLETAAQMLVLSPQTIRLHAGEMTAGEMRTVQAVLGWLRREIASKARSS